MQIPDIYKYFICILVQVQSIKLNWFLAPFYISTCNNIKNINKIHTEANALNLNENAEEIFINISNLEDENSTIESGSKTGSTSSGRKRSVGQENELLRKNFISFPFDSWLNDIVKKPPLPPANVKSKVCSTNSVHGNDITRTKHTKMLPRSWRD